MVGPQRLEVQCPHCMVDVAQWECGGNFVTCRAVSGRIAGLSLQLIPSHSIQYVKHTTSLNIHSWMSSLGRFDALDALTRMDVLTRRMYWHFDLNNLNGFFDFLDVLTRQVLTQMDILTHCMCRLFGCSDLDGCSAHCRTGRSSPSVWTLSLFTLVRSESVCFSMRNLHKCIKRSLAHSLLQ